ncbi:aminoglycoside adenylyltransferase domain-containing protein [Streptomyces erythrochromogenes]|uniref:aminoglycoside adenylyltransferase domain-containing protein n=1 Tax=Streptomyces erythrochromogenes TaxID=285574 RepID=UPI0036956481
MRGGLYLLPTLYDDTRSVRLTLAQVWTALATGEIKSKDAADEGAWLTAHRNTPVSWNTPETPYLIRHCQEQVWCQGP